MPTLENQKLLNHPISKVYAAALALEDYPKILSYVKSVRIHEKSDTHIKACFKFGFSFISFEHVCEIHFKENEWMEVASYNKLFKRFKSKCLFIEKTTNQTHIRYVLDAQFKNSLLELIANTLLPLQTQMTLHAFDNYLNKA